MSGITQKEKDFWISHIQDKINEKLRKLEKEHEVEQLEVTTLLRNKLFKDTGISIVMLDALIANHTRQEQLREELQDLHRESQDFAKQIRSLFHAKRISTYFSDADDLYPSLIGFADRTVKDEVEEEMDAKHPEMKELNTLRKDVRFQIMWATTSTKLQEIVQAILERLG